MKQLDKILDIIMDTDKNYLPYYHVIPGLIKKHNYKDILEIGVFCGGHAQKILECGNINLTGIDPYQMYTPGMPRLDSQSDFDILYNLTMNRLSIESDKHDCMINHYRMTSDESFEKLKGKIFDVVFIDGLHTYEQLTKDLNNYSLIIRKGGVIACHDYNHPTFPDLTVAIDEFVKKNNANLVICPLHLVYLYKNW